MSKGLLCEKLQSGLCVQLLATGEFDHPWGALVVCQHHLQQKGHSVNTVHVCQQLHMFRLNDFLK